MKTRRLFLLSLPLLTLQPAIASEQNYSICRVTGYYEGKSDQFLYELASRVLAKNRLNIDPVCSDNIKLGREIGIKFSKPGKVKSEQDAEVMEEAAHFSNLIYDAILSKVKFD